MWRRAWMRFGRAIWMLTAWALVSLMALAGCAAPRTTGNATPTSVYGACDPTKQWQPPAGNVELDDMAMVAPGEGWAVGILTGQGIGAAPTGVIYHLSQGKWTRLPQTYPGAELADIAMDSPTDGWAATSTGMMGTGDRALVLHYTGGQWRQVDVPALDQAFKGPPGTAGYDIQWLNLQLFGPDAGWMFALTNTLRNPNDPSSREVVIILRLEHGVWTPIPTPLVKDSTEMFWLSAVSGNEAWLDMTDYASPSLTTSFAHYVDGAWSIWPQTFQVETERFTMLSPTDGWAIDSSNSTGDAGLLRFDGAQWTSAATPGAWASHRLYLYRVIYSTPGGATWFTGTRGTSRDAIVEQYADGRWSQVAWPYPDAQPNILAADGSGDLWGVGDILHQRGCAPAHVTAIAQGVFFHQTGGRWSRQVLP